MNLGIDNIRQLRSYITSDWAANPHDPKSQMVLAAFRICQWLMRDNSKPRRRSLPFVAVYRFVTEFLLALELRPKTRTGPGLTIYHGFGLVVNDHAVIGSNVILRNGVVVGNKFANGPCPVIEDGVELGANAVVIGGITVGKGATVGAGAVVVKDVAPGTVVAGNPARVLAEP